MPSVLLVEHDEAVAELARRYLAREGFTILTAATAGQAAAALADLAAGRYQPDVVVLDLTMPGLRARDIRRGLWQQDAGRGGALRPPSAGSRGRPGSPGRAATPGRSGSPGRPGTPGRPRAFQPVVCLTGPGGLRPREAGIAGAACLSRPFGPRDLVVRVRAVAADGGGRSRGTGGPARGSTPGSTPRHGPAAGDEDPGHGSAAGSGGYGRGSAAVRGGPGRGAEDPTGGNPDIQRFDDVALTATERNLLAFLLASPGRVYTRERLLAAIGRTADGHRTDPAIPPQGRDHGAERCRAATTTDDPGERRGAGRGRRGPAGPRAVDVYVAQLRAKLGDRSPIRTVRGVGYSAQLHRADSP